MTERSYFWDGHDGVGHAPVEFYDNAEFSQMLGLLAVFDPTAYGIIKAWGDAFQITGLDQASLIVTVKTGRAIVGNALYESNADISYTLSAPSSGNFYYLLALRKDIGAQMVRQVLLGPSATAYPSPVQTDAIWDFPLANLLVWNPYDYWTVGGGLSRHRYIYPDGSALFPVIKRQGGDASDWDVFGTTGYDIGLEVAMHTGIAKWTGSATSGSLSVTFTVPFDAAPVVFLGNQDWDNYCSWEEEQIITSVTDITATGFSFIWESIIGASRTELHINWMAFGPRLVR